jgi:hypothetical protein
MTVGSDQTRLIVLRGNSGAGKSTVARALREAYGRGVAWVSQDLIRRSILKERDRPGAVNIGLIGQVARYSLDHGYHVVLDGIFYADRYGPMLEALNRDHLGISRFYYLDARVAQAGRSPHRGPGAHHPGDQHSAGDDPSHRGRDRASPGSHTGSWRPARARLNSSGSSPNAAN